ncbi:MAG TPA: hypothetical protein VL494_04645, partial [Steroidobacteraceae bacterium]|nr:hypothetical protein [Steroidobacteraceae bacterium]
MLDTLGIEADPTLQAEWRGRVVRARAALGWPNDTASIVARRHAVGTSLAIAAPLDQLFTATEVNEWALCASLVAADPVRWSYLETALVDAAREAAEQSSMSAAFAVALPVIHEQVALARFAKLSSIEGSPRLGALVTEA